MNALKPSFLRQSVLALAAAAMVAACASHKPTESTSLAANDTGGQPRPPYYSVELKAFPADNAAQSALQTYPQDEFARSEKRNGNYVVRIGAWRDRREAEKVARSYKDRGLTEARIVQVTTPVTWTLANGQVVPVPKADVAALEVASADDTLPAKGKKAKDPDTAPQKLTAPAAPLPPVSEALRAAAQELDANVRKSLRASGLARRDGYIYASDIAPLLEYAAARNDQQFYLSLLPAAQKLVLQSAASPFTRGFVLTRHRDGVRHETTDAGDMLAMARALAAGGKAFERPADQTLALRILDGYAQHAYELQGQWIARRSYSFADRTFASISSPTDYYPDFLADLDKSGGGKAVKASAKKGESLSAEAGAAALSSAHDVAQHSYGLLAHAVSPSRLLYPVIEPEVGASFPGLGFTAYAPNGIAPLADSCLGAEGALHGAPAIARGILDFVLEDSHRDSNNELFEYYDANTGAVIGSQALSAAGYGCLGRVAAGLNDGAAYKVIEPGLTRAIRSAAAAPDARNGQLGSIGSLLLAGQAVGAFSAPAVAGNTVENAVIAGGH